MATTKKTSRKTARKAISTKRVSRNSNKLAAGTYTVPRGHVTIAVPPFWTLRQTNDDLEVEAPSGATSVIVTAFQRNGTKQSLDAREYLEHFLETAPKDGRMRRDRGTQRRAAARFVDSEGDHWEVSCVTDGGTLLLATCNTSLAPKHKEARVGVQVLESVNIRRK